MNKIEIQSHSCWEDFNTNPPKSEMIITAGSPTYEIYNSIIKVTPDGTTTVCGYRFFPPTVFDNKSLRWQVRFAIKANKETTCQYYDVCSAYDINNRITNMCRDTCSCAGFESVYLGVDVKNFLLYPITLSLEPNVLQIFSVKNPQKIQMLFWQKNRQRLVYEFRRTGYPIGRAYAPSTLRDTSPTALGISYKKGSIVCDYFWAHLSSMNDAPDYETHSKVYPVNLNGKGREVGVMSVGGVM